MNEITIVFALIGFVAVVCIIGTMLMLVLEGVQKWIGSRKRDYAYKHRFDKPPTAACYCKDCVRHDEYGTGECFKFNGWRTADNWFCWDANPKSRDLFKDEQKSRK